MHRRILSVSIVIFTLMIAAGCGGGKSHFPEPSTKQTDGAYVSNMDSVRIGSIGYAAEYGTITVLENRNRTTSQRIHLPFIRVHSASQRRREPIFVLNGGPGGSNMRWDWGIMWYLLPEHDIVAVGYRGVDGSTVLDCPEVEQALTGAGDPLCEESMKTIGRAWSASAKRLTTQGIDLDGYTILEVIEDNESVRKALGYGRISLLSGSYGTRVAYLYGLKHPERIHRSAMIAVNPPGRCVWDPRTIDTQLRHYSALWSRDSVMSLKSPDLYAGMKAVVTHMPRTWLMVPIHPGKVKTVTFALLFHRATAAMAFDAYVAAEHGDPSGLALMSLAYDYVIPSMSTWGEMASKAVSADFDSTRNYCLDMEPPDMPLGSPVSKLLWGPLSYGRWPTQQLPEEFRKARQSEVHTLLVSGSIDFANPAEFATNELLPYLTNGKQVILSECGHVDDLLNVTPENTRRILTGFYDTGAPDTSMNTYVPMDFTVRWGFPLLAKIAVGVLLFVGVAIVLLIVWLVRRVW
jgi:pimeloyl-ACP methyl ester carboxylesterase